MKYYYNNQLIRASKNHEYTHAIVIIKENNEVSVLGCRRSLKEAEAFKNSEINGYMRSIENCHKAIKALQEGKDGYFAKEGRKDWWIKFNSKNTVEYYEDAIKDSEKILKNISKNWRIVELEVR